MNIVIVYATNTGNTYLTAQIIRDLLSANHEVTMINANEAKAEDLQSADLVLLGSSSWDWQGKEGHPLRSMKDFLAQLQNQQLSHYRFALFGTGDRDFQLFCGAVDHLEAFVRSKGGDIILEPLKIDKFYIDILHKIEMVKNWAHQLNSHLASQPVSAN